MSRSSISQGEHLTLPPSPSLRPIEDGLLGNPDDEFSLDSSGRVGRSAHYQQSPHGCARALDPEELIRCLESLALRRSSVIWTKRLKRLRTLVHMEPISEGAPTDGDVNEAGDEQKPNPSKRRWRKAAYHFGWPHSNH
ncbi:hypothetical protein VTO73DRAFT_4580 [Trametes versicolor]